MSSEKSMLGPADDFLIHQTTEVIRYAFTSDRRFYDRHFLVGHCNDGRLMFIAGIGAYPNVSVIDSFFSFSVGDRIVTLRCSREMTADRMDTTAIGPVSLTMIEGLKSFHVTCEETDGVSFDLTWTNSGRAFEEPPFFKREYGRVIEEGRRFVQTGRWQGWIVVDGECFEVEPEGWWGSRDHSWGVRSIGLEDEPRGIAEAQGPPPRKLSLWIWAPLQFESHAIHFNMAAGLDGKLLFSEVRGMRPDSEVIEIMTDPQQHLRFDPESYRLLGGTLHYTETSGERRTIRVTPLRSCFLQAHTGYAVPVPGFVHDDDWRHGKYMGKSWSSVKRFDLSDPAVAARLGQIAVHTLCRLELDTGEVGYADVENTSVRPQA